MNIKGYKLCRTDIKELIQQILIWLDAFATSHYSGQVSGFVPDTTRLIVNIKPLISSDNKLIIYDVNGEDVFFTEACSALAKAMFRLFNSLYLIFPGHRSNFYIEQIFPNYTLVMHSCADTELEPDSTEQPYKDTHATENRITIHF